MIRDLKYFDTEVEAHKHGADFVDGWGYGYGASYTVWYSETYSKWVCDTSRYSSCD
jgi:hypothetical protein